MSRSIKQELRNNSRVLMYPYKQKKFQYRQDFNQFQIYSDTVRPRNWPVFEYSNWRQCIWYNCQNVNQENIGTSFNEAFSKQGVELVEIKVKASFTPNCFIGGATKNWPANYPAKLEWVLYTTNSSYYDDAEVEIFRTKPYALQGYYSQGFMCNAFDNRRLRVRVPNFYVRARAGSLKRSIPLLREMLRNRPL